MFIWKKSLSLSKWQMMFLTCWSGGSTRHLARNTKSPVNCILFDPGQQTAHPQSMTAKHTSSCHISSSVTKWTTNSFRWNRPRLCLGIPIFVEGVVTKLFVSSGLNFVKIWQPLLLYIFLPPPVPAVYLT